VSELVNTNSKSKDATNSIEHKTKESQSICWMGRQLVSDVKAGWAKPRPFFLCTFNSLIIIIIIIIIIKHIQEVILHDTCLYRLHL
jgi:hypothetical protein